MENKYYTPDIEDIRVGYECEVRVGENWKPYIVKRREAEHVAAFPFLIIYKFKANENVTQMEDVRTPYLTKEQIEAEGWKFIPSERYEYKFTQKLSPIHNYELYYVHAVFQKETECNIMIKDIYREMTIYFGQCPSINEFRYITRKLLKIN